MSELSDEIFRETFACLRETLSRSSSAPSRQTEGSPSRSAKHCLSELLRRGEIDEVNTRLETIRSMRAARRAVLSMTYRQGKLAMETSNRVADVGVGRCHTHLSSAFDALLAHEDDSKQRLAQLTFEVVGEYAKSFVRANRRYDLVSIADCKTMVLLVMQLRWKRFIYKFLSTVTQKVDQRKKGARDSISGEALSLTENESEIKLVVDALRKRLSPDAVREESITAVIRFERVREKDRGSTFNNFIPIVISNYNEFYKFESELISWISPLPRPKTANQVSSQPTLSRGKSTSGISGDKEKHTGCRLHEFLQSSRIEWLCPSSHCPNVWDDILDEDAVNKPAQYTGDSTTSSVVSIAERMAFSKKFSLQHTAGVSSNRLYFCLEERYLWSKSPHGFSSDGDDAQKFPVLALLSYLQSIYARRSVFTDDAALAEELNGVLDVFEYVGDHRVLRTSNQSAWGNDGSHLNVTFVDLASIYPDIIRAKTRSGSIVHFAPAMLANLLETEMVHTLAPSSDYVRHICVDSKCPHPWLIQLLSIGSTGTAARGNRSWPLSKLYTLSRPNHMPVSCRPYQSTQAELMGMLVPPTASMDSTVGIDVDVDQAIEDAAKNCTFVIPLSQVCLKEMFKSYFGEENSVSYGEIVESVGDEYFGNAAYILPDHSRLFHTATTEHNDLACPRSDSSGSFHHKYILVGLQTSPVDTRKPSAATIGKYSRETIDGMISGKTPVNWKMRQNKINAEPNQTDATKTSSIVDNVKYYMLQLQREHFDMHEAFPISQKSKSRPALQTGHNLSSNSSIRHDQWAFDQKLFSQIMKETDHHEVMLTRNESRVSIASITVDGGEEIVEQKKGWDSGIISSICRWRACLCEASKEATPRYLCKYHADLKKLLDHFSANGLEGSAYDSSKYLPKKSPDIPLSVADRDLQTIRMASPLLQELREGKSKHTVHSYVHRMIQDMALRHRLSTNIEWYGQRLHAAAFYIRNSDFSSANVSSKQIKQRKGSFLSTPLGKDAAKYLPAKRVPPSPAWAKWKNTNILQR